MLGGYVPLIRATVALLVCIRVCNFPEEMNRKRDPEGQRERHYAKSESGRFALHLPQSAGDRPSLSRAAKG